MEYSHPSKIFVEGLGVMLVALVKLWIEFPVTLLTEVMLLNYQIKGSGNLLKRGIFTFNRAINEIGKTFECDESIYFYLGKEL